MLIESELTVDLLNAYDELIDSMLRFKEHFLMDTSKFSFLENELSSNDPSLIRKKGFEAISQLEYQDSQAPREILICVGCFGASTSTIDSIFDLNATKDRFKAQVLSYKQQHKESKPEFLDTLFKQHIHDVRPTLSNLGLGRIHLKQCYRKIPILEAFPEKISWTWAHTRSIKRITIEQAQTLLLKRGQDEGIQAQLHKIGQLRPGEPLAIVQELAPHLRANVVFNDPKVGKKRVMVKGPIPIFYPQSKDGEIPNLKPPGPKKERDESRPTRADVRLDPNVFLPAIRAHRYLC